MTYRLEGDIRDMPGATWRDILADALESLQGPAELERIYEKVARHVEAPYGLNPF